MAEDKSRDNSRTSSRSIISALRSWIIMTNDLFLVYQKYSFSIGWGQHWGIPDNQKNNVIRLVVPIMISQNGPICIFNRVLISIPINSQTQVEWRKSILSILSMKNVTRHEEDQTLRGKTSNSREGENPEYGHGRISGYSNLE